MKIAYILGMKKGIHRFIYRELCEMEDKGNKITILTTKHKKGVYNPKKSWEVINYNPLIALIFQIVAFFKNPLQYIKLLNEAFSTRSLIDFVIAEYYSQFIDHDLVHAHFGDHKFYLGYYLKKITGVPLTVTIHAHELHRNPNWIMFKKALNYSDKIITISEFNKNYLVDRFKIDSKKIKVIRLFVDLEEDVISDKKKILVVGSFEERKGYDVLLKAIKKLKREDYVVWIVGDGHLDIPGIAKKLNVFDKIKFFGRLHSDLLNILFYSCDIFCLPSKTVELDEGVDKEGIPVALMEAMAYGKPVITTKHAGIPELVEKELVEEDNPKQLADKIDEVLDDLSKYRKAAKKHQKTIHKKYSKKNVDKLDKEFKKVLK